MDEMYKQYVVPNGIKYPGKATSPIVYAGNERAQISWLRGTDPKVTKSKIYWNNFTDSVELSITEDTDTIRYVIDNLEENDYTFVIKTYDALGNVSIPVEVSGRTYGHLFQSSIFNRIISKVNLSSDNELVIEWEKGSTSKGAIFVEIIYMNVKGEDQIIYVPIEEMITTINDVKGDTECSYRTAYLPEIGAIDTFYTDYNFRIIPPKKINKNEWIATASSDARDSQAPNGAPEMAIDDDVTTFWHSMHKPSSPGYPHWIRVNMRKEVMVKYIELTPRSAYPEQSFNKFTIQGSNDGVNWTDYGNFVLNPVGLQTQQFALEGSPTMQFIRILMTQGGTVHAHLAEFSVYGS